MAPVVYLSSEALRAGVPGISQSPRDQGRLEMIVVRPRSNERRCLQSCQLSAAGGVDGDMWAHGCWLTREDGSPHPDVQVALINIRAIELIAGGRGRCSLAGDNLLVDFDLSRDSLQTGQRLAIGTSVIEITEQEHTGCGKFGARFGLDALALVNSKQGTALRLRGLYAKVIDDGLVKVGETIRRL